LQLGVYDLYFNRNEVFVSDGKGDKDRRTMLPTAAKVGLVSHLAPVKALHTVNRAAGHGRVMMPDALGPEVAGAGIGGCNASFHRVNFQKSRKRESFGGLI